MRWLAALLLLLLALPARADWEVKRSPFDARLVERYKQLLHKNPDDDYAFKKLVALYKSYRTVDQLVREYSGGGDRVVLGRLLEEKGDLEGAAREFEAAGDRVRLADLDVRLGRAADALPLYRAALDNVKDAKARRALLRKQIDAVLMPSSGLAAKEAVAAAGRAYDELIALDPKNLDLRREHADMLAAHGQPKPAVAEWTTIAESLRADPGRQADAWKRIGELDEDAGDEAAALAAYQKTYALAPSGHHLRREAIDKIIGVYRKKDELRTLIGTWERDWTSRGFVEWETLARLHDEAGEPVRAKECFIRALQADPHAIDARRRLIALYEREGKSDEALAEWKKLVQAAPGEPRFRLELAERLWKTPDGAKEALALCERLGRETADPSVHATLAELYARWGQADRALAEREKLVRLEPGDDTHLVALGELWYQRGKKEKALEIWKRILNVGGKKEQQLARLADVYAEHEMAGESLELYQKAVKLAPGDATLQKGLAAALERVHRDVEAEEVWMALFDAAAQAGKRSAAIELRQHLITLLQREGKLSFRAAEFRKRTEAQKSEAARSAWALLTADAELKLGHVDAAEAVLRKLAEKEVGGDPESRADALVGLSQVYRQKRKLKEAVAALERAAELAPARAREIYAQIAELSLQLYRDADALAYAKKAIALGPADAQAQVRLGEVCERRDDDEGAAAAYQRALELDDRLWRVHFTLARLQLRRGELPAAARLYRDVIRRAPDEELVVDATRRAIDLEEYLGTLGELERELAPLAYAHPERKVYQKLLVELYLRHARPLVPRARAGDETARRELERMGQHALRPLLDVLAVDSGSDAGEQRQAMALLGDLGNSGAAAPLLKLALTLARKPVVVPDRHNLFGGSQPAVPRVDLRVEAALAGARLAGAEDLPSLLKLSEDPEKNVRAAALFGLGRSHAPAAQEALVKALSDGVPDLQAVACLGLGRQAARSRAAELVKLLRDGERDGVARAACAFALGAAFDGAGEPSVRAALADTLEEGADEVQEKAAWALGRLAGRGSPAALVRAVILKREPVRSAALAALAARPGPGPSIDWIDPPRNSDGLDARGWVAALGPLPAAAPPVNVPESVDLHALGDDFADALSRHRDLQLRALQDLDAGVLGLDRAALDQLALQLVPLLRKLAGGADRAAAAGALRVLAHIDGGEPALAEAAASPRVELRLAALEALGEARPRVPASLGPSLEKALSSSDWRERRAAARALGHTGDPERVRALGAALDDPSGFVREAAAASLDKLTRSPDARLRAAAHRARRD